MGIGEFILLLILSIGSYKIIMKIINLVEWNIKYEKTCDKSVKDIENYIKSDDFEI